VAGSHDFSRWLSRPSVAKVAHPKETAMRPTAIALTSVVLLAVCGHALAAPAAMPPPAPFSADECAVFERELSFARSVADHDAAAFAAHIAPDAAFAAGSPTPQRGRDTIARAWAPIVRGDGIRLAWYPERTTVVGDIAWSTGPALFEESKDGTTQSRLSTFQSVWRQGADGTWLVVFDGGTPPRPADAAAVAAFHAARPAGCPSR
jgi:ketosteroid isomerase-like protein